LFNGDSQAGWREQEGGLSAIGAERQHSRRCNAVERTRAVRAGSACALAAAAVGYTAAQL